MAWQDTVEQIQNIDFSDTDKIGVWPMPIRLAIWLIVFALLIGATWWFFIKDLDVQLNSSVQREAELRTDFETKAFEAANLEDYRAQMVAMDEQFNGLLSQLPSDIELPELIDDVADKAENAGLILSKREFLTEAQKEFIVEKPFEIVVQGNTFHDLGGFVSGVAGMPRIVTLHDFIVRPVTAQSNGSTTGLQMSITAKTYRYRTQEN